MRGRFLAQRRNDAKRYRVSQRFRCAVAPLREKHFMPQVSDVALSTFVVKDRSRTLESHEN